MDWNDDVLVLTGTPKRHIIPPDSFETLCGHKTVDTTVDGKPSGDSVRRFTGLGALPKKRWCKRCYFEYRRRLKHPGSRMQHARDDDLWEELFGTRLGGGDA